MLFQYGGYAGNNLFQTLVDWGLIDALLPFLLIFVIVFAVLQRIAIFGTGEGAERRPDRRINLLVGIIVSAMIVVPHVAGMYPIDSDPIVLINMFLPHTAVLMLAILCVMLLIGLAGGDIPNLFMWVIALIAVAILIFVILMATVPGFFPWFDFLRGTGVQAFLIMALTAAIVIYFLRRGEDEEAPTFGQWVNTWFGPPPRE